MKPSSSYTILKSFRLQYLLKRGFTPTSNSIYNFLLHLSKSQKFNIIIQIFNQLNPNFIHGNFKTHFIYTDALLKLHKFEQAESFINTHWEKSKSKTKPPDFPKTRFWDALIQGFCVEMKNPRKGLHLLKDCLKNKNGVCPSSSTFYSLIVSFICEGNMSKAIEVVEIMNSDVFRYPFDNFVCSAVISRFCRVNKPELAVGFFDNAFSSGALKPNLVTYTAVVTALCMLGRVHEVRDLVFRMEKEGLGFDEVFYSNWICGYFREGMLNEGFLEHKRMVETGLNPDSVSYTVLIDGFCKGGNVEKAFGFLSKMIKDGMKPNSVTYTAIIRGLCKKGKVKEAFSVFKNVEDSMDVEMDEFMYATLIDGVCRKGDLDHVFSLLGEMEKKGIKPSIVTYNTVVNELCKVGKVFEADEVSKGVVGDIVTYSTLLHGYVEVGNVDGILETKRRFEEGVCMDVVMCNIVLKALVMVGSFEDARALLYHGMPEMGLEPNSITYCTMMDGYSKAGRVGEALEFFDEFRKVSTSLVEGYDCIINSLCQKGMLDIATEVFIELINKKGFGLDFDFDFDVFTTLLKSTFTEKGEEGVLSLVYKLEKLGPGLVDILFNDAIGFLCRRGSLEAAMEVYVMIRKIGSFPSVESYYLITKRLLADRKWSLIGSLTSGFVKEYGLHQPTVSKMVLSYLCMYNVDTALRLLEKMKENLNSSAFTFPTNIFKKLVEDNRSLNAYKLITRIKNMVPIMDVVDYTIMINGLCVEGYPIKALKLCSLAKRKGVIFNIVTYNTIIHGLCKEGCFVEAFRVFNSLEKIGLVHSEITYSILIDSLGKEGLLVDARKMFDRMILKGLKPNIRVYNSIIFGYCKFGNVDPAMKLLSDLDANCISPDEFTTSAMIFGYCQKGDMEEALVFFDEFNAKCKPPDFLGFLYLIKGLCSKGRIEEARGVLREMLRSKSVEELINRIDSEVESESESVKGFLEDLCEQGSIQQAVTVLDEIGSMFFPKQTIGSKLRKRFNESDVPSRCITIEEKKLENFPDHDFSFCYSVISSLCSKGELKQANRLVKNMICKVPENR